MRIEIHSKNIDLDESLRTRIERRLGLAIGRFQSLVQCVRVQLSRSNGAIGMAGKRCGICVELSPTGEVEIEDSDEDLNTLTDRAVSRVGLAVFSELYRRHESNR